MQISDKAKRAATQEATTAQAEPGSAAAVSVPVFDAGDWTSRIISGEALGAAAHPPAWLAASYGALYEQVMHPDYPCYFGTIAERRGEMFYAFVNGQDTRPLAATMAKFAELATLPQYRTFGRRQAGVFIGDGLRAGFRRRRQLDRLGRLRRRILQHGLLRLPLQKRTDILGGNVLVIEEVLLPFEITWIAVETQVRMRRDLVPARETLANLVARFTADHFVGDGIDEYSARLEQQYHARTQIAAMARLKRGTRAHHECLHPCK